MHRNVNIATLVCTALLFSMPAPGYGLDSLAAKAAFQFLEDPLVPRLVAMGGAGTAFNNGGFTFVNPAQPLLANDQHVSIGYAPMPGDLDAPFFETSWVFPDFFAGVYASNHSISGIVPANEQGPNYQVDPFSYGFTLLSLDIGYKRDRMALGLTINGMQERIETSTRYGVSVSIGGLYRIVPGRLTAGLALFNEGTVTAFTYNIDQKGEQEPLPRSARLGVAYSDTLKDIPVHVAGDIVYRDVGDKVKAAGQIVPRMTVPVGIEVWPTSYVAVRIGKRINFETEVINFGAGLRFAPLTFDMAFVISQLQGDIEVKPVFGLTYAIAAAPPVKETQAPKQAMVPINVTDTASKQKAAPVVTPVSEVPKTAVDSASTPAHGTPKAAVADSVKIQAPIEQKTPADSTGKGSSDAKTLQPKDPSAPEKPAQKN